jgi:hypothetical protein
MPKLIDLTGTRFGRLTIVGISGHIQRKGKTSTIILWECQCDCGGSKIARGNHLRDGRTKSCGCITKENNIERLRTHGLSKTSIYGIWIHLRERCSNPKNKAYRYYGARGISVCQEWQNSFDNFFRDMGATWFPGGSIERIDVNGNYCPKNCEWILLKDQSKNRRSSIFIDSPWGRINAIFVARKLGISPSTMYERISKWPKERWCEPPNLNHRTPNGN